MDFLAKASGRYGYSYGPEFIPNGGFEVGFPAQYPAEWYAYGSPIVGLQLNNNPPRSTGLVSILLTVGIGQGFSAVIGIVGIFGQISMQIGKKYLISGWVKNVDATNLTFGLLDSGYAQVSGTFVTTSNISWTKFETIYTCAVVGVYIYLAVNGADNTSGYFDNISVREVL